MRNTVHLAALGACQAALSGEFPESREKINGRGIFLRLGKISRPEMRSRAHTRLDAPKMVCLFAQSPGIVFAML
jgi:hypothetical protein